MRRDLLAIGLFVVAVLVSLHHWQQSRARITASRVLLQVESQILQLQRQGKLSEPQLQANIELLRRVESLDPAEPAIALQIGSHYLLLQRPSAAVRWYEKALQLEPRPEIFANLSLAYRMANETETANEFLRKAKILDPMRFAQMKPVADVASKRAAPLTEAATE